MEEKELHSLIKEANQLNMLKQLFRDKLNHYNGITHSELENVCIMLGFYKEGDRE